MKIKTSILIIALLLAGCAPHAVHDRSAPPGHRPRLRARPLPFNFGR